MTLKDILKAFELEIGLLDDNINKPLVADSMYWLDQALLKFIKLRFNRDFTHHTGFEQNEKRFRDLDRLVGYYVLSCKRNPSGIITPFDGFANVDDVLDAGVSQSYSVLFNNNTNSFVAKSDITNKYYNSWPTILDYHDENLNVREDVIFKDDGYYYFKDGEIHIVDVPSTEQDAYDEYIIDMPDELLYVLSESVLIDSLDGGHQKLVSVFECTHDNYAYRISNSLTDFHYKNYKARPLRIRLNGEIKLLTDKNYEIKKYILSYIAKPYLFSQHWKDAGMDSEYDEINETALPEIIKMAAQMYLENTKDDRYKTITQEVLTQE